MEVIEKLEDTVYEPKCKRNIEEVGISKTVDWLEVKGKKALPISPLPKLKVRMGRSKEKM